jgi:hypothetical protein
MYTKWYASHVVPKPFSLAQLLSLGYSIDDHFGFEAACLDDRGAPIHLAVRLIGLVDDRGRSPDFCYMALEGFPESGRVISKPFDRARADFQEKIERHRAIEPEWRDVA